MAPGIFRKNPFHLSSSHGREGYDNYLPPGPPHLHNSQMSYPPFISGDPTVAPGAVSTADCSHPFYSGPPPTVLGSRPVVYPSPNFQNVSTQTQATFFPTVPVSPSVTSMPPASFCAPPSHHLGRSPASFINPPSDHRLNMSFASLARLDIQPASVSRVHHGSHVHRYAVHTHRRGRSSNRPLNMYPAKNPMLPCPLCPGTFGRLQDRDRHVPSHLPYWIGCSFDGCSWRGYRLDTFRKHWYSEHKSTNQAPDEDGSTLYDPKPFIRKIVQNPASKGDAEFQPTRRLCSTLTRRT
jgi:hypothetical protein